MDSDDVRDAPARQEGTVNAPGSLFFFFGTQETFREIQKVSFGWKFHVAGDPSNFQSILEIIRPIVMKYDFILKALRRPLQLKMMAGTVQQSKAFTIYFPQDKIAEAAALAAELSKALEGSVRPALLPVRENSFRGSRFVYYRYGEYEANKTVAEWIEDSEFGILHLSRDGQKWFRDRQGRKWLIGPAREKWMDRWTGGPNPPWISDPFEAFQEAAQSLELPAS